MIPGQNSHLNDLSIHATYCTVLRARSLELCTHITGCFTSKERLEFYLSTHELGNPMMESSFDCVLAQYSYISNMKDRCFIGWQGQSSPTTMKLIEYL